MILKEIRQWLLLTSSFCVVAMGGSLSYIASGKVAYHQEALIMLIISSLLYLFFNIQFFILLFIGDKES